jgi:hypothetical protein
LENALIENDTDVARRSLRPAAPDGNAENEVRDNGEARDFDALMPKNSVSAPSQPAILFFSN